MNDRYLSADLKRDVQKKMILLSGPRQTGKSTLARHLLGAQTVYLNWDIRSQQKTIREMAWNQNAPLVVLDEIHKFHKWKNFLKGVVDEFHNRPSILVTGSVKLDTFRKQGDALTGRFYHYRLHPIDVAESKLFLPKASPLHRAQQLLQTGGFPEAFLNPSDAERLRNDRLDLVLSEDLVELARLNSPAQLQLLIELLRERVGQQISYANLAKDLSVSSPTVKSWLDILQRLYLIFMITPFTRGLARSLRKEPKVFFYDCASAYEQDVSGARLENLVASSLLKYCDWQRDSKGKNFALHYFRDKDKREVDFIVTLDRKPHWCIEVKSGDHKLSSHLEYLHHKIKPKASWQLVLDATESQTIRGIHIEPLAEWLDQLG